MGRATGSELTFLAVVAGAKAIDKICGVEARIKWPNDLVIGGKKLAGILVESRQFEGQDYVIGIGVNCQQQKSDFPLKLQGTATSIRQECGREVDRIKLGQEILRELDQYIKQLEQEGNESIHKAWLRRCDDVGKRTTLICNGQRFSGRFGDVDPRKGLLLRLYNGPIRVFESATTTVDID